MSEELQEGLEAEEHQEELQLEAEDTPDDPDKSIQVDPEEERARKDGWTSREEWEGSGKNPDDWVSATRFNERGQMMGTIKKLNDQVRDFDSRLENNNKFHKLQMEAMKKEYENRRDQAIEAGDKDAAVEAMNNINAIDNMDKTPSRDIKAEQSDLDNFNRENPWIFETSPKSAYAKELFTIYHRQMPANQAIERMMSEVGDRFPDTNPNRDRAPSAVRSPQKQRSREKIITMKDVTGEEMKLRSFFGTDEEFLKAVKDARA